MQHWEMLMHTNGYYMTISCVKPLEMKPLTVLGRDLDSCNEIPLSNYSSKSGSISTPQFFSYFWSIQRDSIRKVVQQLLFQLQYPHTFKKLILYCICSSFSNRFQLLYILLSSVVYLVQCPSVTEHYNIITMFLHCLYACTTPKVRKVEQMNICSDWCQVSNNYIGKIIQRTWIDTGPPIVGRSTSPGNHGSNLQHVKERYVAKENGTCSTARAVQQALPSIE